MVRPLRMHLPGGFYHVTLRGNHKHAIFRDPADRGLLDGIVADAVSELAVRIHAYCWMTNHVHLLAQVSNVPLGRFMLRISSRYARIFQAQLDTTGHLFERRYHAVLVDADRYLLTLVRYIHQNPVRAGLVKDPSEYLWSSHRAYVGMPAPPWITTAFTLRMFAQEREDAVSRYCRWMEEAESGRWGSGSFAPHPENSQVLGDDAFLARVSAGRWHPGLRRTLDELITECSGRFGVDADELTSPRRTRYLAEARAWLSHEAVNGRVATISAIARRFGRSETAIRRLMARRPCAKAK